MSAENRHIEGISGARATLQTSLDNLQTAIETDNNENMVYKDDDGTYHIIPNIADNVNFANILSTGIIGYDADTNHWAITDEYAYLLSGGKKIIDYIIANELISINAGTTAIDIILNGENAGNVGIGTTTPSQKLDVVGNARTLRPDDTTANGYKVGTGTTDNWFIGQLASGTKLSFRDLVSSATLLTIEREADGGKIGIYTTSPTERLDVVGNIKSTGAIIYGGLTTTGAELYLKTKETTVVVNDILGAIKFSAPLEASGDDAVLTGAAIVAIAEDTFSATVNATSLQFKTGESEAATTKATLSSAGVLTVVGNVSCPDVVTTTYPSGLNGAITFATDSAGDAASAASSAQTQADDALIKASRGLDRLTYAAESVADAVIAPVKKQLTDGSAVGLFEVALPTSGNTCGGMFSYRIHCWNGTDFQSHCGVANYAAGNKAGTITSEIGHSSGVGGLETEVESSGTLTDTFTTVNGTGKVTITLNANTSLTPSANEFYVTYTLHNDSEMAVTIL